MKVGTGAFCNFIGMCPVWYLIIDNNLLSYEGVCREYFVKFLPKPSYDAQLSLTTV